MNQRRSARRRAGKLILAAMLAAAALESSLAAEDPPYPHGAFRADCAICHRGDSWRPARASSEFDHAKFGFALTGAHSGTECLFCHETLSFDTARGAACADCHQDVHAGELGAECDRCHTTRSFVDRADDVRSHRLTRFPLTGAHLSVDCASCHAIGPASAVRFANTPSECISCHDDEYRRALSPNHVASGFSTDCEQCHSTLIWSGSTFDHGLTGFPLTGGHTALECARCHENNSFGGGVDPACVACHRANYDATTSPSHTALGFGTDCASCHGTASWQGATFDHDTSFFPIYSSPHRGEWTSCATCHTNPVSYQEFTCFSCHPHSDRAKTDENHGEVSGYSYDSQACYSCHPRGRS